MVLSNGSRWQCTYSKKKMRRLSSGHKRSLYPVLNTEWERKTKSNIQRKETQAKSRGQLYHSRCVCTFCIYFCSFSVYWAYKKVLIWSLWATVLASLAKSIPFTVGSPKGNNFGHVSHNYLGKLEPFPCIFRANRGYV